MTVSFSRIAIFHFIPSCPSPSHQVGEGDGLMENNSKTPLKSNINKQTCHSAPSFRSRLKRYRSFGSDDVTLAIPVVFWIGYNFRAKIQYRATMSAIDYTKLESEDQWFFQQETKAACAQR